MSVQENSSLTTIFTIINSMIGGAMLTFPILFREAGILTSILVLFVSSLISYKTCRIYILHLAPSDNDAEDTIRRIMGPKWQKFFRLITGFYLVLLNMIYIVLIVDQTYNIIYFIMTRQGYDQSIADKDINHLVFDRFSKQYLSIIMFIPLLGMTFIKNLSFLIKLASYGVFSVFVYFGFLIYEFTTALVNGIDSDKIIWINSDIGGLAGTSAVAFTVHTVIATIMKSNKQQANNLRDLKISYLLGLVMYCAIGWIGSIAIWDKKCDQTIINCYLKDFVSVLVDVTYLYGRLTVYPCFIQVARSRLLLYYYPQITDRAFRNFNLAFMGLSTLFCFLGPYVKLDTFMNLVGSLVCFFFIYYIPSKLHLHCFYKKYTQKPNSLLASNTTQDLQQQNECCHNSEQIQQYSQKSRKIGYLILNLIGILIGIYGIYQVILSLTKTTDSSLIETVTRIDF